MSDMNLEIVLKAVDRVSGPVRQIAANLAGLGGKANLQKLQRDARCLTAAFGGLARSTKELAGNLLAMSGIAGGLSLAGIGKGVQGVIKTSAEFERLQSVLEVVEGSSDAARKSLDWVSEFAKKTPYELGEVADSFVKLKAYGLDPADGTLKALGDTSSALGKPLMQGVEAMGDALNGENERLKEFANITSKKAGGNITYTWVEAGKQMEKTVNASDKLAIKMALLDILSRRFGGAMDKQSGTWNVLWSNLMDSWTRFQKAIGDAGFFEFAKGQLQ